MWFPMMPGRHYQIVEVLAPAGYQLPNGQWRVTVEGAVCQATIAGTHLDIQPVGRPPAIVTHDRIILCRYLYANFSCANECDDGECYVNEEVYYITNQREFWLPLAGGAGTLSITIAGVSLMSAGAIFMTIKMRKRRRQTAILQPRYGQHA